MMTEQDFMQNPSGGSVRSILVTDDDRGTRRTVASLLTERGFVTWEASSGEEAIEIAQVHSIDLGLFDMHMPGMTGLEALQQIRFIRSVLPAILMTADANQDVMRQALQIQVFSVIPKPINTRILIHTLYRALSEFAAPPDQPPDESSSAS